MGRIDVLGQAVARRLPLRAALYVGAVEGRIAQRLGRRGPKTAAVRTVFDLTPAQGRRVAREQSANSTRTRNLRAKSGAGLGRLVAVAGREHLEAATGGVIVVVAPWGPMLGIVSALLRSRREVAVVANIAPAPAKGRGFVIWRPAWDGRHAAVALKRAVDHLRGGNAVVVALVAGPGQGSVGVPFFGGTLQAPRGIAAMARQASVPVVPVTAVWKSGRRPLRVSFHAPMALDRDVTDSQNADDDLLRRVAATFETVVRSAPEEGDRRLMAVIRQAGAAATSNSPAS